MNQTDSAEAGYDNRSVRSVLEIKQSNQRNRTGIYPLYCSQHCHKHQPRHVARIIDDQKHVM